MKIAAAWLRHPGTVAVMTALADADARAWFVGGCVRNALIGQPVTDIDIATDALPDRVMSIAAAHDLQAVPTGIDHGTVTVVADGLAHEITTLRKDVATDGRRATVAYTDQLAEDAARRDFTINALYADASGAVRDPLGTGEADLRARRVRFIGAADDRIAEDYLRILRFFRFHAWYADPGGGMDADGFAACAAMAEGLDRISAERIGGEVLKLLAAADPAPAIASMAQAGILSRILPEADPTPLAPLIALEAGLPAAPIRRLAALTGAADGLRLSRRDARRLAVLRQGVEARAGPAELGYREGAETARDILLLRAALFGTPLAAEAVAAAEAGARAVFPLRAADLMPAFSGPALGQELARLEKVWIASGFTLSKAALLLA